MSTIIWIILPTAIVSLPLIFIFHHFRIKKNQRLLEEKQAECDALVRDLESARDAKYELLNYVKYEIRAPLAAVIGLSDILMESDLEKFQRKYLEMIYKSGSILMDAINGILDLAQMETGSLERSDNAFNLEEIIENIQMIYGPQAREKGLELTGEIASDLPVVLVGDDVRLSQILVNLVTNAIRFTYKGKVSIRVAVEKQYADQIEVTFSVQDTGLPVPPEAQNSIFSGATNQDEINIRGQAGAGLGLAITAALVKLMEGHIGVETPPESGCLFRFTLPFRTATRAEAYAFVLDTASELEVETERALKLQNMDILVAEDNLFNQSMIAACLEKQGATVTLARNGFDALKASRSQKFDLILMDTQMPELDGLEAARCMQNTTGDRPPIIGLTARSMNVDCQNTVNACMDACEYKPIRPRELIETILRVLDGSGNA